MSDRSLIFSEEAEDDIRSVLEYTLEQWGEEQQDVYAKLIQDRLSQLLAFPAIGMERPELSKGLHSLAIGRHVVFFRIDAQHLLLLRLLHARMDPSEHLG